MCFGIMNFFNTKSFTFSYHNSFSKFSKDKYLYSIIK
jgi:hypothetical protein